MSQESKQYERVNEPMIDKLSRVIAHYRNGQIPPPRDCQVPYRPLVVAMELEIAADRIRKAHAERINQ